MRIVRRWSGFPGQVLAGLAVLTVLLGLAWIGAVAIEGVSVRLSAPTAVALFLWVLFTEFLWYRRKRD